MVHQGYLALLMVDYEVVVDLSHISDCKGGCVWITWNLLGIVFRHVTGKWPRVPMTSDQTVLYVIPRLGRYASPLYWLIILEPLIVPLSGVKSYVVVLSSYIKMMKRRTLQICNLKHSIKKDILFCLSQAGGSPPNTHQRVVINSQSSKWSPIKA